jgi:CheY-like chemotaxis protein
MSGSSTQPKPTAFLLLIMATDEALRLYSESLEEAGYAVQSASSLKDVEQACDTGNFDLILVADTFDPKMKQAVGATVRHFFPETPILQMGRTRPDIEGDSFVTGSSRDDVLRSVKRILRHDEIRPAAL